MKTFCFIQIFLAILSFSLGSLYPYHLPNLGAQILLFIWNVFPYERLKQVSGLALGVAAVSSGFCALIAFIRAWRYIFFPVKENLSFFFAMRCVNSTSCNSASVLPLSIPNFKRPPPLAVPNGAIQQRYIFPFYSRFCLCKSFYLQRVVVLRIFWLFAIRST